MGDGEKRTTRTANSFSPCQITGFFVIHDRSNNPLKVGSTGAGVNLRHGVTTSVRISRSRRPRTKIAFNGKPLFHPIVSQNVIREQLLRSKESLTVEVDHESPLPMGCGYGTSGAGALSLSLALNEALGGKLTRLESAQIAHRAEVVHKTGLGTVTSAFYGGLGIRTRPGAPGIARIAKLAPPSNLRVVSGTFGPMSTSSILSNVHLKEQINQCGGGLVAAISKNPNADTFLTLSRKFAECLGLFSPRLRTTLTKLERNRVVSSMMMIGESVFTIVQKERVIEVSALIKSLGMTPIVSRIASTGARIL